MAIAFANKNTAGRRKPFDFGRY